MDLTKVVSISALYAEAPNWVPPEVSQPYDEGDQASASLSDIYSQPATLMDLPPYEYGAEAILLAAGLSDGALLLYG